jgi:hypothetical protein
VRACVRAVYFLRYVPDELELKFAHQSIERHRFVDTFCLKTWKFPSEGCFLGTFLFFEKINFSKKSA